MSQGSQEVELKLSCTPATARRLAPLLSELTGSLPRQQTLRNTYYDTPAQDLRRQGAALRIRLQGRQRLQTVKCNGQSQGGLSSRPEWETPYRGRFDFSAVSDPSVRAMLNQLAAKPGFNPTLSTDFVRTTWAYRPVPGIHILLMLDRGHIEAGGQRTALCELELELVEGTAADLLALAARLNTLAPLFPSPLSKAARGGLLLDRQPTPQRPPRPCPNAATAGEAFALLLQDCLDHISLHHPANCAPFTAEHLHQMRVGLRRLHALLRLFRPALRKPVYQQLARGVRRQLHALGDARNAHVLLHSLILPCQTHLAPRLLRPLHSRVDALATACQQTAVRHLQGSDFSTWLLGCSLLLHDARLLRKTARQQAWVALAQDWLDSSLREYAAAMRRTPETPHQQHRLRIRTKQLRYRLAVLAPAAPQKLTCALAELQETLGQLNDLYTAGDVLQPLLAETPTLAGGVAAVGACHEARHAALLAELPACRCTLDKLLRKARK